MGDFNVHRLRIGDWVPCAIKSIAADPLSSKIAVGRDNGDIEICDSMNKWYCQARIPGMKDFKLQTLVWSPTPDQSGRLFGISLRGFVFEVDLHLLRISNIRDTYGGTAWAMSANPRAPLLAVGCEDGVVRLFRYEAGSLGSSSAGDVTGSYLTNGAQSTSKGSTGILEYARSLPTSGSRVLSVAYHPTEKRLFAGCSDGSVRCMEEDTGRVLFRMLGDVLRGSVSTLIWSLLVLPDSTVVTGDSRGQVQVWDGQAGVLMDSFRQHTADVLALAASADGSSVFAAGVDGKVICLQKAASTAEAALLGSPTGTRSRSNSMATPAAATAAADNTWVYVHAHRAHSHDVLALAVCQGPSGSAKSSSTDGLDKKRVSFAGVTDSQAAEQGSWMLLSGGVDTRLCTYSVDTFVRTRPTWIPPIPTNALVQTSRAGDILALRNREYVDIWGLALQPAASSSAAQSVEVADGNCRLRLRLQLKGNDHIHCSALSAKGDFIAVSSATGVRVYQLSTSGEKKHQREIDTPIVLTRAQLPETMKADGEFAHALAFVDTASSAAEEDGAASLSSSSRKRKSSVTAKSGAEVQTSTLLAVHCAKKGVIVICECRPSVDGAVPELRQVQIINHRGIVQSRTGSMDRVTDAGLSQAVHKIVFSADGKYLAVSSCGSKSIIYVYDLSRQKLHWILPPSSSAVTDLVFRSSDEGLSLVLLTAGNLFRVYDVLGLKLDAWSESNETYFPSYVQDLNAPLCGVAVDPASQDKLILYGQTCCVHVDLTKALSADMQASVSLDASTKLLKSSLLKKRRRGAGAGEATGSTPSKKKPALRTAEDANDEDLEDLNGPEEDVSGPEADQDANFVVFNKYRNLLHVGYLSANELVVVENPWARVLPTLPDTLARKRYGT